MPLGARDFVGVDVLRLIIAPLSKSDQARSGTENSKFYIIPMTSFGKGI